MQSVLDYREKIEEKILSEFSEKKRELDLEKTKLKKLVCERENLISDLRNMRSKTVHAEDIASYISYVEKIREKEKKQKDVIHQVKEQVESKRKELVEAVKKRKVMEKLKEQHAVEYEKNIREREQKDSDEMSVLKFGRRGT